MESDIKRWLSFAEKVETELKIINHDIYSDKYIDGIYSLLSELRCEATLVMNSTLPDNQKRFFRVNELVQEIGNSAHFAQYA